MLFLDIPSFLLTGEIEAELIVSDGHNGTVHASSGFVLDINLPPLKPTMEGPNTGVPKTKYEYTIVTIDPDGDEIYASCNIGLCGCASDGLDMELFWKCQTTCPGTYHVEIVFYDIRGGYAIMDFNVEVKPWWTY